MIQISQILRIHILCASLAWGSLNATEGVVVNTTSGKTWYHLKLNLNKGDFRQSHPDEYFNPHWPNSTSGECHFSETSGHFQIYIKKSIFPVPARNCRSEWLKVTIDGRSNNEADIESKRIIWEKLNEVASGERESVDVVIELNPYVTVVSKDPLVLALDYCNLYFRTAWGSYVDHTGPISEK